MIIESSADEELERKSVVSRAARQFHARDESQANVLAMLRAGAFLMKHVYEQDASDGSRLAPIVEQLRNAHGFKIGGHGTKKSPYFLVDRLQLPALARVTPEMQKAYYETSHWAEVKAARLELDGYMCVVSKTHDDLQCHHLSYANLFCEPTCDLMTVCEHIHKLIHKNCRLKFPSGLPPHLAERIGWNGFPGWLLLK